MSPFKCKVCVNIAKMCVLASEAPPPLSVLGFSQASCYCKVLVGLFEELLTRKLSAKDLFGNIK